jgi:glycerophosphoryl diester phosphodiesterase
MQAWPYPFWIAHRGAGTLAPENTLAAFRLGAHYGFRMTECDARLSADGRVFLLHDDTLERTSSASGPAGALPWDALRRLDAGAWHSAVYAGEPLPSLEAVADWCLGNAHLINIELKPSPGRGRATGETVAAEAARLWAGAPVAPLLSSFDDDALRGAKARAPALPRALLMDKLRPDWPSLARELGCVALVARHTLWSAALAAQARAQGLRCLSYTVNDEATARRLIDLGLDGLITDKVDLFGRGDWRKP